MKKASIVLVATHHIKEKPGKVLRGKEGDKGREKKRLTSFMKNYVCKNKKETILPCQE